jgi:hypothetical protein
LVLFGVGLRLLNVGEFLREARVNESSEGTNSEYRDTQEEGHDVLDRSDAADPKHAPNARVAYNCVLNVKLSEENQREPPVFMESGEHIEIFLGSFSSRSILFTVHDSAVEHIEEVHKDEGVE